MHLEADLGAVIQWTHGLGRRWAFSLSNAGAYYTEFRNDVAHLSQIDWRAIAATDFRSASVKESKQAEFLVHGSFPWTLVSRIGVRSASISAQVTQALAGASHRPPVAVLPNWYY
ncbi:MAG: DUF4433 domain-containing protein [Deltaproteobacteria bacterium]|nr:DUF4433 domain-containing protein [Deltaproteobacteria bacterium]